MNTIKHPTTNDREGRQVSNHNPERTIHTDDDLRPRCKTCKWWTGRRLTAGHCMNPKLQDSSRKDGAFAGFDQHELYSTEREIETGPNFGCVHHEPATVGTRKGER